MNLKITPNNLSGEVVAPPSKSIAHRLIILCSLLGKEVVVENIGSSQDVLATVMCMQQLGCDSEIVDGNLIVHDFHKKDKARLNCFESGSTLRFLLPVCSVLGIRAEFSGSERLLNRPIKELIDELNNHGANIKDFTVNGKIESGEYTISGKISSQYITGLLLALSLLEKKSTLKVTDNIVSGDYINITLQILKDFGKKIEYENGVFMIYPSTMKIPNRTTVEGDFSNSAFFLSAGGIANSVSISGLNKNSLQGDKRIIDILTQFGAEVFWQGSSLCVKHNTLSGITVDIDSVIDLAPIVAVVGAFAKGKTVIKNIARLKDKESNRIVAIIEMLKKAKIDCFIEDNELIIVGGVIGVAEFNTFNDHRIAMAESILATFSKGESIIKGAEVISKSYPNFYKDFVSLGGKIDVNI